MALTQVQGGMILASGQSIPKAALPTGSVLQVAQSVKSTLQSLSISSGVYQDISGLSVSITPTSASSKILVLVNIGACGTNTTVDIIFRINRDSTVIGIGSGATYNATTATRSLNAELTSTPAMTFLDSPATTSSVTYKVTGSIPGSGTLTINGRQADSAFCSISTITVMEIAA